MSDHERQINAMIAICRELERRLIAMRESFVQYIVENDFELNFTNTEEAAARKVAEEIIDARLA